MVKLCLKFRYKLQLSMKYVCNREEDEAPNSRIDYEVSVERAAPGFAGSAKKLTFSPSQPTAGPIRSSSQNVCVCVGLCICPLPMRFSQGSKGGPRGAKLSPTA